ncbi:MAG: hypothetical protein JWR16_3081 [Nevskia sp.]|nr:hypothetical protein [Nevskia sp.]
MSADQPLGEKRDMSKTENSALQTLIDKDQIQQVLIRYCDAADRADEALLRSVFHPEGTDEHAGMFAGAIDELAPMMIKMHDKFSVTQHSIGNIVIDVDGDGEVAQSRCQITAHHRYEVDGQHYHLVAGGRYLDHLEKRDGEWRIASRVTHMDWSLTHRIEAGLPSPF